MTNDQSEDWMKRQAAEVGARVRRVRSKRGMSVQAVADTCTNELGYKMLRTTLVNLEAGSRRNITVAEISVLAKALGVPPLALLFPIDEPELVEVLPGVRYTPWDAWRWFSDGLGTVTYTDPDNAVAQEIREALIAYGLLTENAKAWERTESMIRNLASLNRGNDAAQASLKEELENILVDTNGSLEFLEPRKLPLPADLPERWLTELRKTDSEIAAMLEEIEHGKEGKSDG